MQNKYLRKQSGLKQRLNIHHDVRKNHGRVRIRDFRRDIRDNRGRGRVHIQRDRIRGQNHHDIHHIHDHIRNQNVYRQRFADLQWH